MRDKIRQVLNINDWVKERTNIIVLPDVEKAFDRLEWQFLKTTLRRMNFGSTVLAWINMIYQQQMTKVMIDGYESKPIRVE